MKKLTPRTIALSLEYHLFKKDGALLGWLITPKLQALLRRRARARYLLWEAKPYHEWMERRLAIRKEIYKESIEPGLLSIVTPVWNGTPLNYLELLAESIGKQNTSGACEWLVLDNGCDTPALIAYFKKLQTLHKWVKVHREPENRGIVQGLRVCLENASGRYILPVDSDDWLYPDCLRIVQSWIRKSGYPPLLYTDEDKRIGAHAVQPYFKPDFDPVLLLNSAYIAHLGVIDRKKALELDAYADKGAEGSPDWDLFVRFLAAGYATVHIPEVVYSWRMHPESTADDAMSKPYIHASQRAVLQRFLDQKGLAVKYAIEYSPLLNKTADFWYRPNHVEPVPALLVELTSDHSAGSAQRKVEYPELQRIALSRDAPLASLLDTIRGRDGLVCLVSRELEVDRPDWLWDAVALFERHPDAAMVGGRISDSAGSVLAAGQVIGFGEGCGCPDRGRPAVDPGYFTQMRKQRSVSAVSSQLVVVKAEFLREVLARVPARASLPYLGAWAGAIAAESAKRVVYSPFLSATSRVDWDALVGKEEKAMFLSFFGRLAPDHRYYPKYFGMEPESAYRLV